MTIRCKMTLNERREYLGWVKQQDGSYGNGKMVGLKFSVVGGDTPENDQFFASTPIGSLDFSSTNWETAEGLEIGAQFYVDLIPVE